jgi:hypothetical protein
LYDHALTFTNPGGGTDAFGTCASFGRFLLLGIAALLVGWKCKVLQAIASVASQAVRDAAMAGRASK